MKNHTLRRLALGVSLALTTLSLTGVAFARCAGYTNGTDSGTNYSCSASGYEMQQTCSMYCCPGSNGVATYDNCQGSPTYVVQNGQNVPCPSGKQGTTWTTSISCPATATLD